MSPEGPTESARDDRRAHPEDLCGHPRATEEGAGPRPPAVNATSNPALTRPKANPRDHFLSNSRNDTFSVALAVTQGTEKRPRGHPARSTAESRPPPAADDALGKHVPPACTCEHFQLWRRRRQSVRKRTHLRREVTSCSRRPRQLPAEPRHGDGFCQVRQRARRPPRITRKEGKRLGGTSSARLSPLPACPPPRSAGLPGLCWPPGRRAIPGPAGSVRPSRDGGQACSWSRVLSPGRTPPWEWGHNHPTTYRGMITSRRPP